MPAYSKKSIRMLQTCHPDLQTLFNEVIKHFDCTIIDGHRGMLRQNYLYFKKKSRAKWPNSSHNATPSDAVDVAPYYSLKPHIRWGGQSLKRWYYFAGIVKGIALEMQIPVRWGGDWDSDTYIRDQEFNDLAHWELV